MVKTTLILVIGFLALPAFASNDDMTDLFFSNKNPKITKHESQGLSVSERWQNTGIAPVAGQNGSVSFQYGAQQPSIVCAVLQVCDIALQAGEQLNNVEIGDTVRWTISPAVTGSGADEVLHLIVKPLDVGLETSLVVTTNRRAYHLRLKSHRTEYMPKVTFSYPEDTMSKLKAIKSHEQKDREQKTTPKGEYLSDLDFKYDIDGSVSWKPTRVFNDGKKTIIEMPSAMAQTEAPTLLVVRKEGGLFSDDETVMVNYRVQGDRYIVDTIFDRAILIAGVGSNQDMVTLQRIH